MKRKRMNIFIIGILFVIGLTYIVYTGVNKSWVYYWTVEEFFTKNPKVDSKIFRLSGNVIKGSIKKEKGVAYFEIGDSLGNKITVVYSGVLPRMIYQEGAQVVIEGTYDRDRNVFNAHFLLTQCPSKYQAQRKVQLPE